MLYVKVDAAGNPVEAAKNYRQIRLEHEKKNAIFPSELTLQRDPQRLGYAQVPTTDEQPTPVEGKMITPDIPVKNADGSFTRKWKYVDALGADDVTEATIRERRDKLLSRYVDQISPLRWEIFSEAEKEELAHKEGELRDQYKAEGLKPKAIDKLIEAWYDKQKIWALHSDVYDQLV